ncbi:MAG: calcium-binding protein [Tetrasphaera sp.]
MKTRRISSVLGVALAASALVAGTAGAGAAERRMPGNDNFENAYRLTGYEASSSSTTVGATGQPGEPGGSGTMNTVWWKWVPPISGPASFDTYGSALNDAYLCIFRGSSLGSLTNLGCDDDGGMGLSSALRVYVTKGTTYYLQVDGWGSNVGGVIARARFARCNNIPATVDMTIDGEYPTSGNDIIAATEGNDVIDGLGGNDAICGLGGDDQIGGGPGNDYIDPGTGDDWMNGGSGTDTVSYRWLGATKPVQFDLSKSGAQYTGSSGYDRAAYIENLEGGSGNDTLKGNAAANALIGGGGNDTLSGLGGNDRLDGKGGTDRCDGGPGLDSWASCEIRIGFP